MDGSENSIYQYRITRGCSSMARVRVFQTRYESSILFTRSQSLNASRQSPGAERYAGYPNLPKSLSKAAAWRKQVPYYMVS